MATTAIILAHTLPTRAHFPYPYDWYKFPAAWFGANATNFENETQLEFIGQFSLAIFGWQHLITATNWTASVYSQLNQAAILKDRHPTLPVYVYTGFGNADGYNAASWPVIRGASDGCHGNQPCRRVPEPYSDWVLQTDSVPVYSMSACEQMAMGYSDPPTDKCWNAIWNVANASMRDYYIEEIIQPLANAPAVDGVFFDCFNFAYQMPSPWNRHATNIPNCTSSGGPGCAALLNGTLDLARRIALSLNAEGKVPMFSNPASFTNPNNAPIWLDEARLVKALEGTSYQFNYEFMRAESVSDPKKMDVLSNMLKESELGVPAGVHTYLRSSTEDPTPHLAVFMLVRQEYWFSFSSTGWLDSDWAFNSTLYQRLTDCGRPINNATSAATGVFIRDYMNERTNKRCHITVDCSNATDCKATIEGPL